MSAIQKLLTDHIDIWTAADTEKKSGRGRSSGNAASVYGIKKLRELILELAVRGKLVPQDPSDEPASELLRRIEIEKNSLAGGGSLKRVKPRLQINEAEKTFNLPQGWEWAKLGNVIDYVNGYAFSSTDFAENGIGVVKIGDIQNGRIESAFMSRISREVVAGLDTRLQVKNGDLLIAMSGATTGKLGFNDSEEIFYLNQRVGKIDPFILSKKFLFIDLSTKIAANLSKSAGSAIPNLSTEQINDIVLAMPPLPEQHRIVAKVDELMALCDELETRHNNACDAHEKLVSHLLGTLTESRSAADFSDNWQRIAAHFDTLFTTESSIDALKQTLLQLAVMGMFSPGSKQKKNIDDKYFDIEIPENWRASMLSQVTESTQGVQVSKENQISEMQEGFKRYLYISDFSDSFELKFVVNKYDRKIVTTKDLVMANTGATCGTVYKGKDGILSNNLFKISFSADVFLADYLFLYLKSEWFLGGIRRYIKGGANPHMGHKTYGLQYVFIPPVAEQKSIVGKVDEITLLCDRLRSRLTVFNQLRQKLADVMVEQAVIWESPKK